MFHWLKELYDIRLTYLERKAILREVELRNETQAREDEHRLTEESLVCKSCEVLKLELAKAHDDNKELLRIITTKPTETTTPDTSDMKPINMSRHLPFQVRRQMLEAEDRRKAAIIAAYARENASEVKVPVTTASTEVDSDLTANLENELDLASAERENQSGNREVANGNESGSIS